MIDRPTAIRLIAAATAIADGLYNSHAPVTARFVADMAEQLRAALDEIEQSGDIEDLRERLAAVTAARDEACDLIDLAASNIGEPAKSAYRGTASALRKVGS